VPLVPLQPIAGKFCYVEIVGQRLPFARWTANFQGEYLECNNFNRWPFGIVGIEGGEVTFGGRVNISPGAFFNYAGPPLNLRADTRVQIILGFTPTLFLPPIDLLILGWSPTVDVNGAADFEYRGQVQGNANNPLLISWYLGGPYQLTPPG
jgi:hypothetical protein